jgi:hypothetical protein
MFFEDAGGVQAPNVLVFHHQRQRLGRFIRGGQTHETSEGFTLGRQSLASDRSVRCSCFVRAVRYRARVPDPPDELIPARRDDLIATLAFVLTRDSRLAKAQSAELLASIVAERIVDRLEAAGYVVMQGSPVPGGAALGRGHEAQ